MNEVETKEFICPICDTVKPSFAWTDTHGVAQCTTCGVPIRLYHYDDENKRVEKAPECVVLATAIPLLRRYRAETGKLIPSGCSFPGGYELAKKEDFEAFNEWWGANAKTDTEEVPA